MISGLLILLAFFFVLFNAFFVAAEFSIVKIRHTRVQTLQQKKGVPGKTLAIIHEQLDSYLSACQLGITLASLGLGWIGEPAFAHVLAPLWKIAGIKSAHTITFLSFLFAFSLITYMHIVIGELMPKSVAIRKTEQVALWTGVPLYLFYWMMYPAIWLLNASANIFLKIFKLNNFDENVLSYSSDEIKLILRTSHRYGEFNKSELELLTKSLIFTDLEISDVMRPLDDLVSLNINSPLSENINKISMKQYSRYPVYRNEKSNIFGILHVKDLLAVVTNMEKVKSLSPFVRSIMSVKDNDNLLSVFHKFRKGKPHLAIVTSAGKSIGFVTLDNILQAIIGEIKDEFHITEEDWYALNDGSFIIKGSASIFTLKNLLGIELPETNTHTLSGLIMESLQGFPKENQEIAFDQFTLVVKKIRGPRILQIRVYPKQTSSEPPSTAS
ncbi:MAG: HlyC/CorC family transporter [Proteobacteria bacterium]|nr:HlyC/CorC family transporter [Pseudomonadota bacterium]